MDMTGDNLDPPSALERALPEWLAGQRWFRGKSRAVARCRVRDPIPLGGAEVAVTRVEYSTGVTEDYALYLLEGAGPGAPRDALAERGFCARLLELIASEGQAEGLGGAVVASSSEEVRRAARDVSDARDARDVSDARGARDARDSGAALEPVPSGAEQSNSSVVYGRRFILKLYRRVEPGVHPDLEVGRRLTAVGFPHAPRVEGHLEHRPRAGEPVLLGLLQAFLPNEGDGWSFTLAALGPCLERVRSTAAGAARGAPAQGAEVLGDYAPAARLLGRRTAELHLALGAATDDPAFAPEPFTEDARREAAAGARALAAGTLDLLAARLEGAAGALPAGVRGAAREVLAAREAILERLGSLAAGPPLRSLRIRGHGDYHLGQVLRTRDDFAITDFEGEVTRPLAERRRKASPLRDAAGMLRSFHYAAYASILLEPGGEADVERLAPRAAAWHRAAAAAFLEEYRRTVGKAPFFPREEEELGRLLRFHLLEKAIYEVGYELQSRPGWLRIPLEGVLEVLGGS
ncbi:MAG: putative maltokinase [Planctomycetes bacterium]|nr:putative maltokinase [Planctomycetota bacterium]